MLWALSYRVFIQDPVRVEFPFGVQLFKAVYVAAVSHCMEVDYALHGYPGHPATPLKL
jgi:hypothetical protein